MEKQATEASDLEERTRAELQRKAALEESDPPPKGNVRTESLGLWGNRG